MPTVDTWIASVIFVAWELELSIRFNHPVSARTAENLHRPAPAFARRVLVDNRSPGGKNCIEP